MKTMETITFNIALVAIGVSIIFAIWWLLATRVASRINGSGNKAALASKNRLPVYLSIGATALGLGLITLSLITRAIITGHGPFSNMYEFAVAFSWGILAVGLFFWWRYRIMLLNTIGTIIALGLMIFAYNQSSKYIPLVPALQQNLLLTLHVASAIISYGAFTIGFSAAILYLIRSKASGARQNELETLDSISYHSVMVGFPFMTMVIVFGALWADIAWGSYWSWDPKETASLVTWLLYAAYLHARILRGWRGRKAAILLLIGFAAVVFTFFGNFIFTGMHSYR